jgi:hypothetical protein
MCWDPTVKTVKHVLGLNSHRPPLQSVKDRNWNFCARPVITISLRMDRYKSRVLVSAGLVAVCAAGQLRRSVRKTPLGTRQRRKQVPHQMRVDGGCSELRGDAMEIVEAKISNPARIRLDPGWNRLRLRDEGFQSSDRGRVGSAASSVDLAIDYIHSHTCTCRGH